MTRTPSEPVGVLIERLSDADPARRLAAVEGLMASKEAATQALDALVFLLDDEDADVRMAAINAIGTADPVQAEGAIAWGMQSPDYRVAVAARLLVQGTAKLRGPDSTVWRDPAIGLGE